MFEIKKFGDVCDFVRGPFGGSLKKNCFVKKGFAVYEQQHAIHSQFTQIRYFVNDEKFKEMLRFELKPNDLIMSCSGTMGKVAIVPHKVKRGIINQALLKLTPKKVIDVEYLRYWMSSPDFEERIKENTVGAAIKNVASVKILKQIDIPIPPLSEQKAIVKILDEAFAKIEQAKANIETNIENAKELFQSKLNEIFSQKGEGWEEKTLGNDCIVSMGQSPKGTTYNSEGVGTPLINGPVEFGPQPFSETVMSKWTTEPTKMCEKGDLILCVRGSTTGRINISGFKACIGRGVASIRYSQNQEWINFFIRCKQQAIYDMGTGSTFPNVSSKILSNLKFSEPISITVQDQIIVVMKKLEENFNSITHNYSRKIADLADLKKSLLQKAFSGELTKDEVFL